MFTQMNASRGIKEFGERAIAAIFKEYKQLNDGAFAGKPVVGEINPDTLTPEQKRKALDAVNLIKQKRCGKIKGRTCANGSKQKRYLKEGENIASPTMSLEALISTLMIDAKEERYTVVFDVPGAYLHAEMPQDKHLILKLRGQFVDIMCKVNPEYTKHVRYEGKTKVLYLRILRAIYGCIESALLWYQLYSNTLSKIGFIINPYDRCVANKMINGKQCTIGWYVDDNKLSHEDKDVVEDILKLLSQEFGELTIQRGPVYDFLGMEIEFVEGNRVKILMKNQIQEAIHDFGEVISRKAATPATRDLHVIREDAEQLDERRSEIFHSVTMKLMYIGKRARPDIETAVGFLSTRVSKSDVDDWNKLKRVLQYLYGTIDMPRYVGADNFVDLHTWVDAAYAVHPDMRSQTGGCMSYGQGIIHGKSTKQKLNTKSSTEAELVGISEYLPYNIWTTMFMEAQGYKLMSNTIYQDNQSTIRMAKNGRNSCTGNSRHINIRYFFVKDRVDKDECTIEYCPTMHMLADFFTKPLQGQLFRVMRDTIMGHIHFSKLEEYIISSSKERVEEVISTNDGVELENNGNRKSEGKKENEKGMFLDPLGIKPNENRESRLSGDSAVLAGNSGVWRRSSEGHKCGRSQTYAEALTRNMHVEGNNMSGGKNSKIVGNKEKVEMRIVNDQKEVKNILNIQK